MKFGVILSLLMALAFCYWFLPEKADAGVEIALEAELADTIMEPMVVGTLDDIKKQKWPAPPTEPSHGEFIWMPGAPTTGGGGEGYAEFIVDIPEKGTYSIWGFVTAWDGNSDSFWVTWQPADPDENPQVTQNTEFRWGVRQGNDWHWDRINQWLDGGTFEREWKFDRGETILRIWTREDATMLDALFITDEIADNEAAAGVRLPTDDDVQLQLTGLSVQPGGKLSTTWAEIKKHP